MLITNMQSRYWMLTGNAAEHATAEWWRERFDDSRVEYLIGQLELAPETEHRHAQVFVIYPRRVRWGQVTDDFNGCHVERMVGTVEQCITYCSKPETRIPEEDGGWSLELGERPVSRQGKRTDLEIIRDLVKDGMEWVDIIDHVPQAMRYAKEIRAYRLALEEKKDVEIEPVVLRDWQQELFSLLLGPVKTRRIFWVWSEHSAVGKTTTMRVFGDTYRSTVLTGTRRLNDLMHAYDVLTHRVIWFDLSRSDPIDAEMTTILEQLSNGGYVFSGKYESTQKRVKAHIVVTCNRPPPNDRLPARCVEYRINAHGSRVFEQVIDVNANGWLNPDFIL